MGGSLVWEDCCEMDERFPHLYEPLPGDAAVSAVPLASEEDGTFQFPSGIGLITL